MLFMSYQMEVPDRDRIFLTPYAAKSISTLLIYTIGRSLKYLFWALCLQNAQTEVPRMHFKESFKDECHNVDMYFFSWLDKVILASRKII